jgi:type III pantothenate kinase
MLLTVDIGNTNIVIGGFKDDELVFEYRLVSDLKRTVDEYKVQLVSLMSGFANSQSNDFKKLITNAVICSVVPPLTPNITEVIKSTFDITPLEVGAGIKTGLAIKVSDPTQVGADRIVNSVAVKKIYGNHSLVVDFGTATTFDYVNNDGAYEGGVIAPGLNTSIEALVRNTAKLPRIDLVWPEKIVGKNTVHAMQSGALVGYVCLVDGIIDNIQKEVGQLNHIIATGGLGSLIVPHSKLIQKYDPILTLTGMKIIASLNSKKI